MTQSSKSKLNSFAKDPLRQISSKIKSRKELADILESIREKDKKSVFTNGCFDIVHAGHISCLAYAKSLGDFLIVGLNSDLSIKQIKGENRPIIGERQRALLLASFLFVDFVSMFDEKEPTELIRTIKPDFLVKGGDWAQNQVVGADIVESYGGKVKQSLIVDGLSTTNIIQKIIEVYKSPNKNCQI